MEPISSRKRPQSPEDEEEDIPAQKRARFPKSKKLNAVVPCQVVGVPAPNFSDPRMAATERANRRIQFLTDLFNQDDCLGMLSDITAAEVDYNNDGADFVVIDGVRMEPFNLELEREGGYYDEQYNFVEYADNQIKDAWLDSVNIHSELGEDKSDITEMEEETPAKLSSEEVRKKKKRIADVLEPEETVLQALKRLKRTSTSDMKEKMPEAITLVFDQLTEDAMQLMENGDYNVYHEKREVLEGNEKILGAKEGDLDMIVEEDEDIFAEDDGSPSLNRSSKQKLSESFLDNCVYDESLGYYYNRTFGYYYDPVSGFFCSANTGMWYSYDEQTGT